MGEGEPVSDHTGDSYDKIIPPRSAPSSFDAPMYPVSSLPGNFFNSANSHSDSRLPSRSLGPLSMNAPSTARSRKTPVSGGGLKSADYFNTKPLTAEPDPLIDCGDSPTTVQSASSIARPLAPGSSVSSSMTLRTPTTLASSVTPETPWLNHSNASYTSYTYFKSNKRGSVGSIGSTTSTVAMTGPVALARMTESEKKGYKLQMRVYKARGVLPFRIMLRVFREPGECVETWDVVG
ncbi:hypothetical protein EV359DRAFT_77466 [Lentinula novae-zelandiae]|nr:hypothetical protein EV359DRAFT_77466 [Lentinula novae-zelandiae]